MINPQNYLQLKLNDILTANEDYAAPASLKNSFGDAYLYKNNPVFKTIRDHFIKLGGQFTTEDFCHYQVFPYASLPQILKAKKVPYCDNTSVLKEIESLHPKRFTCAELIKVKSNYTLHESSHCIADHYLEKITAGAYLSKTNLSSDSKKVFRFIMAESFANSVESFANVFNSTAEQKLFYELNSYVTLNRKVHLALESFIGQFGSKKAFELIYVSYLYSNCLQTPPSSKLFQRILATLFTNETQQKKASQLAATRKVFDYAFELDIDFRMQTTGFFCAYMGFNAPLEKLLNIDILEVLTKTTVVQDFLSCTSPQIK